MVVLVEREGGRHTDRQREGGRHTDRQREGGRHTDRQREGGRHTDRQTEGGRHTDRERGKKGGCTDRQTGGERVRDYLYRQIIKIYVKNFKLKNMANLNDNESLTYISSFLNYCSF